MLLIIFPILVITTMLYPGEKSADDNGRENRQDCVSNAVRNGLAVWDIIDMSELMFGDVGCYVTFGTGWLVFFYIALGVSAILTAFSAFGLEKQPHDNKRKVDIECPTSVEACITDDSMLMNIIVTSLSLFFNDILFLVLRLNTMLTLHSYYIESVFVVKEILSICARFVLICTICCCDRSPYQQVPVTNNQGNGHAETEFN